MTLQDAVKKYIFKKHFGDDGTLDWNEMAEDYDPFKVIKVNSVLL